MAALGDILSKCSSLRIYSKYFDSEQFASINIYKAAKLALLSGTKYLDARPINKIGRS